jgi:DNA polymerase III sliding clamp (beta) subunit (PCNA family)
MKIIGPAYEEALERLTARLSKAELTFENQDIWNFVKRHGEGRYPQYSVVDERSSDRKFHARIEAKLKAAGALKYRFADRKSR